MSSQPWLETQFPEVRPKAIAALTRQFRDIELAEDAFATACLKALNRWPVDGMPRDPFAWLLAVARNSALDNQKRDHRRVKRENEALTLQEFEVHENTRDDIDHIDEDVLRDDVLRLLFICCHPDLKPQDQAAIALRIVCGLSVSEIAGGFLVSSAAMEQRITRAKKKILVSKVSFMEPDLTERHLRITNVMRMIYLLFSEGWSASSGEVHIKPQLCVEAIRLARLLLEMFPDLSEAMGLLSLFLYQHAKLPGRVDAEGNLIHLDKQERTLWDAKMISEANTLLERALQHCTVGPYQVQGAIAGVHANSPTAEVTDWREVSRLYSVLYTLEPTPVVKLNHAAAVAEHEGPRAALDVLVPLRQELQQYRWYHSTCGALHADLGEIELARDAYEIALNLEPTANELSILNEKLNELAEA